VLVPDRPPVRWLPLEGETPPDTLARLCREVRAELGADLMTVWLYDAGGGSVRLAASDPPPSHSGRPEVRLDAFPAAARVLVAAGPVSFPEVTPESGFPAGAVKELEVSSLEAWPLGAGNVAGMLTVAPAGIADERLGPVLPYLAAAAAQAAADRPMEWRALIPRRCTDGFSLQFR
jgi:hypothetical protein